MTQSHPLGAQSIPAPIQWAINVYGERLRRAGALGDQMAKLEVRIAETERMLQQMRHHYATIGREHTTMQGDAELLLLMIQQACARVGIDVPLQQSDRRLPHSPEPRRAIGHSPAHAAGEGEDPGLEPRAAAEEPAEDELAAEGPAEEEPVGEEPAEEEPTEEEPDDVTPLDVEEDATLVRTVRERHDAGASQRAIARELDIDRRQVKRILEEPMPAEAMSKEAMSEVPAG